MAAHLSGGVQTIVGNLYAFAAIKGDGSVVTWGDAAKGGDSQLRGAASHLSGGVQTVVANLKAFAAVKADGSVVTWGDARSGGDAPSHRHFYSPTVALQGDADRWQEPVWRYRSQCSASSR